MTDDERESDREAMASTRMLGGLFTVMIVLAFVAFCLIARAAMSF